MTKKIMMVYKGKEVRLMAESEGWAMVRNTGCVPFTVMFKELSQPTKRAVDVAYECPKCGNTLEKDGWCDQHGLPAQPRN